MPLFHIFTSLVFIRGFTSTRIAQLYSGFGPCRIWVLKCWRILNAPDFWHSLVAIGKPRVSPFSPCIWYASTRHISSPEDRITSIKHCAPRISSKMATIDEFALKNIGLWWRYGMSRHCDEWKYSIIGRIFESEIIVIPPSLKISESSSNGSYRNTDEVWWRYGISRSCDECPL